MRPLIQRRVCRAQIATGVLLVKLRIVSPDGSDGVVHVVLNNNVYRLANKHILILHARRWYHHVEVIIERAETSVQIFKARSLLCGKRSTYELRFVSLRKVIFIAEKRFPFCELLNSRYIEKVFKKMHEFQIHFRILSTYCTII